jgi:hypothetical protein
MKFFLGRSGNNLNISPGETGSDINLYKYLYEAVLVSSEKSPKSPIKSRRKCGRLDRD